MIGSGEILFPRTQIDTEYLLTSRPAPALPEASFQHADRAYWGIETGLHLRLDVSPGEDRSRGRPTAPRS